MVKGRPKISLTQTIEPRTGDMEGLFSTEEDIEQAAGLQLLALRLDALTPDPEQPRRTFPEGSLLELSESIKQDGVIQPIEVTQLAPNKYKIVHGERRWKAARIAGLDTIPAVVRRRDYDSITRFVRQLVENIQREDLNDVDRAAGLLHLRDLMQDELDSQTADDDKDGKKSADHSPWAKTISWAKVGGRLGYSRQRIHQLIRLLDLPEEIKQDIRDGKLNERDARIYHGLQTKQQKELHQARYKQKLSSSETKLVSRYLKKNPSTTVAQGIREIRHPMPAAAADTAADSIAGDRQGTQIPGAATGLAEGTMLPPNESQPTNVDRLVWVRGQLASTQRKGLSPGESRIMLRLLNLIQQDVNTLISALQMESGD